MKCIQTKTLKVFRISNEIAKHLVREGDAKYVSKETWRNFKLANQSAS